ncbi:hypothetical protein T11_8061 [Trichinella zimbabwensis]|uniref:Uncharacterized protein n=1 Tax=Trichinella zimbabwensis TaxID=268475 RepID=A0A0V1GXL2_9BILA|nr:hypothetical protein T11_8061 [Trichinella zimbabwensis]
MICSCHLPRSAFPKRLLSNCHLALWLTQARQAVDGVDHLRLACHLRRLLKLKLETLDKAKHWCCWKRWKKHKEKTIRRLSTLTEFKVALDEVRGGRVERLNSLTEETHTTDCSDVCATRFSRPEGRILGPTNDHCRLKVGRLLVNWRCKRKVNSNKASARKKSAGPPTDRPTD